MTHPTRRDLILGAGALVLPWQRARTRAFDRAPLSFGLCADVHQDVMHDAVSRMRRFVEAMSHEKVDFLAQLGDFCTPRPENRAFLSAYHAFEGPTYHVIGNHEMDGGFSREQVRKFFGMKQRNDTFIAKGVRFIVLDGNDPYDPEEPGKAPGGYSRHVATRQREWLGKIMDTTTEPVIVFSHQSLENARGIDNGAQVRSILESANEKAGWRRVGACFSGHHHLDALVVVNDIPYVQINSMSYYWVGPKHKHRSYSEDIHDRHRWIEYTSPYENPLWARVTVTRNALKITGVRSRWVGASPEELGHPDSSQGQGIAPRISDRRIALKKTSPR